MSEIDIHELLIEYPFPLRSDFTVKLLLPRDLTQEEVQRLTKFLRELCRQ